MKSEATVLKIQSYVDGELPQAECREVERLMASNPELREVCDALRATKTVLRDNQTAPVVQDTREFYFSQISRRIQAEANSSVNVRSANNLGKAASWSWFAWARQHFVGLSGVGMAGVLAVMLFAMPGGVGARDGELELASDDMGAYTYRDQQQEVSMVWLYDRASDDSEFTDAVRDDIEDSD